ncbi:MAG: transglutaminase domain-containing protein [Acidobacteriota bacterium]
MRRLRRPKAIQRFLDEEIDYNKEKDGETCRSPRRVLRDGLAHCAEGAYLAAAALRILGHRALIVDLVAVRDDDHLLAVFKTDNRWGAIAKSNYSGLRFREPVYLTIRELCMSYFPHYYNLEGELTLRAFSRPVDLQRFDSLEWMTTESDLFVIGDYLNTLRHSEIMTAAMKRRRRTLDRRLFDAGLLGAVL